MSETTLTTKQVEDGFAYEPEYEYSNPTDTGYVERNRRAFRKWHAAELRKAKAEALREAASAAIPRKALAPGTRIWLRARADEMEGSNHE